MSDLSKRIANLSPEKRALFELRFMQKVTSIAKDQAIPLRAASDRCPVSFAQQRLWVLDQFEPGSAVYNIPAAVRLSGLLDVAALEKSLNEIVRRHEALRTTFTAMQGEPLQVIRPALPLTMVLKDLRKVPESEREVELLRLAVEDAQRPFNLSQGPLIRATLLRLDQKDHVLLLTLHHIVSDGWSMGVLFRELSVLYKAFGSKESSPLPELPIQYADFAVWQRQWLQGEVLQKQLNYWKKQLHAAPPLLEIPGDRPRPVSQAYRGAHHTFLLPQSLTDALKALCRREEVTLFMLLLAGFKTLLCRYSGQSDIIIGSPIAGRNRVEVEELIGFFVNTLVLRTDLSANPTFKELLGRVREVCLGAYAHQDLPFEKLVGELQPARNLSYSPLFQVMFILQNAPRSTLEFPSLTVSPLEFDSGNTKFDLTLSLVERSEGLRGVMEYDTAIFDAPTIEKMAGNLRNLLEGVVANPEQRIFELPLLTAAERHQMLVEWNDTKKDFARDKCIHHLFEAQVGRSPEAVALVFEDRQITFGELNHRANQLAHHLKSLGVEPEELVGIFMERSLEMIVGLLGILKAGGSYVPMDPAYPQVRLNFMLQETGVPVLLTQKRLLDALPEGKAKVICLDSDWAVIAEESDENLGRDSTAVDLAYVMYTSGSTGKPKGVIGLHRGAVNRFEWMWKRYPFEAGEICCQKTSLSFVDSVWEIFGPLLHGIRTVIIPDEMIKNPHHLIQYLADKQITRIVLVPSLLRVILDADDNLQNRLPKLKLWISSGEILSKELCQRFHEIMPQGKLLNLYGSSEVSADVTCYDTTLMRGEVYSVPIGRPISNTHVYILDRHQQPLPVGVAGELHIGGDGLARGYLNYPELTTEKFIQDPFNDDQSARLYKTGDLARFLPDGNIEYVGRIDHQVKMRGFRIEPGEIEFVLSNHEAIKECAVVLCEDAQGNEVLVAFIVCYESFSNLSLRRFLRENLPHYMIPAQFIQLDALPLTPNGKIDRKTLSLSVDGPTIREREFVPPNSSVEKDIAKIWRSVLSVDQIGLKDNFFDLGGHSLMVIKVISMMQEKLKVTLKFRDFMYQTLGQIAAICEENKAEYAANDNN